MIRLKTIALALVAGISLSACNDYLDINPENSLPTEEMWKSKSDVESALFAGYYNVRGSITSHLIPLGELRAGIIKTRGSSTLARLEVKPTTKTLTDWKVFYKTIADANGVIANAQKTRDNDATYSEQEYNSHLTEAYFLRALSYFYVVRNWRNAPLVLEPIESDDSDLYPAQANEADVVAQIKADLNAAMALGAAKEQFDTNWETKGRATIWAIYALMSDVCLWSGDFDEAITYADRIIESRSPYAPRFMSTPTHSSWFKIFNPGNSEESIFELQYSATRYSGTSYQTNTLPTLFYTDMTTEYLISGNLVPELNREATNIFNQSNGDQDAYVRTRYGSYVGPENSSIGYVWKYIGGSTISEPRTTQYYDPNFLIYRVAEVMLMKAEALIMRKQGSDISDNQQAIDIINQIRTRSNLTETSVSAASSLIELLEAVLQERRCEFIAEGKAWYDVLRVAHYKNVSPGETNYVGDIFIPAVVQYNESATENKIKSTLMDENAWYLPVNEDEMNRNPSLVQNPYYE